MVDKYGDDNLKYLLISDVYENNLKHISVKIPLNAFTCVTGCSGGGKSSLVFDTIFAESQRCFIEGMTGNIYCNKIMDKPKVSFIKNLHPTLSISQKYYNTNPRSTIGTVTDISYYLRSLFSIVNSEKKSLKNNSFSYNNPLSCCPNCLGLGTELEVSERLLIPDKKKTLREGGITFFKGPKDGEKQKYLEALCEVYDIDIDKKISQLTNQELEILLYKTEKTQYMLSYKEGRKRRKHYVDLQSVSSIIKDKLKLYDNPSEAHVFSKYLEENTCHVCGGLKLNKEMLSYSVNGLNYSEVENLEMTSLVNWLQSFDLSVISKAKAEIISGLIDNIIRYIQPILQLKLGYLPLSRKITTLSGGEIQRIRIASQLKCSLSGLIYILDEPCKGLHYHDITSVIDATKQLIRNDNTVIAIEHNKQYIAAANNVIELGPEGGPNGGYIIDRDGEHCEYEFFFKSNVTYNQYLELEKINYRNIKNQNVALPLGGVTCITGVSGSGKSTLMKVISECLKYNINVFCEYFYSPSKIKAVTVVDQSPIGKNSRSTVVSYLGIYDEIRTLFASVSQAKDNGLSSSDFSMNVKGGRCECCQGTGLKKFDLNYLPSSYIVCPECAGKRFNNDILSVYYKGNNIHEILESPIYEIIEIFENNKKITSILSSMEKLGLGYIRLGQTSMSLSGGEAQRIKLAKALGQLSNTKCVYFLDEPTSGLSDIDICKFEKVLSEIQKNNNTIVIVEHNLKFIARNADYILDFGMAGGALGGKVISAGKGKDVFNDPKSSLYGLVKGV